jgi:hypothetical protein
LRRRSFSTIYSSTIRGWSCILARWTFSTGIAGALRLSRRNPHGHLKLCARSPKIVQVLDVTQLRAIFGAIAHRRCRLIWKILHEGIRYEECGPAISEKAKKVRARKMSRDLRSLGYHVELLSAPSGSPA